MISKVLIGMVFCLGVVLLSVGVIAPNVVDTSLCRDSDGGLNIYELGYVTPSCSNGTDTGCSAIVWGDECTDNEHIKEYYCSGNNVTDIIKECTYGCENGKCIKNETKTCSDSDGDNIFTRGITTGYWDYAYTSKKDYCESSEKVKEYKCADGINLGTNIIGSLVACPEEKICHEGACILKTSMNISQCTDSDGGLQLFKAGVVYSSKNIGFDGGVNEYETQKTFEDSCCIACGTAPTSEGPRLREWWCDRDIAVSIVKECNNGCINGACRQEYKKIITNEGTYEVRVGAVIEIGEVRAEVKDISLVTVETEENLVPMVWINGPNAQVCNIRQNEVCTLFTGPVMEAKPYLKIIANEIEVDKEYPYAKISIRLIRETKEETVTCVFEGGGEEDRKCYFDSDNRGLKCEAGELNENNKSSCSLTVTGAEGSKFAWKSTCGGYQYTTMDGTDETVTFSCLSDDKIDDDEKPKIKEHWFNGAFWECYDGQKPEDKQTSECRPYGEWKKEAVHFCNERCTKCGSEKEDYEKCGYKCGVVTFSVLNECYPSNITDIETEDSDDDRVDLVCKDSCPLDGKCYQFGYRKGGKYCADSGAFVKQQDGETGCDNNWECSSNICVSSQCVSEGLMKKILKWFKGMFGGE